MEDEYEYDDAEECHDEDDAPKRHEDYCRGCMYCLGLDERMFY